MTIAPVPLLISSLGDLIKFTTCDPYCCPKLSKVTDLIFPRMIGSMVGTTVAIESSTVKVIGGILNTCPVETGIEVIFTNKLSLKFVFERDSILDPACASLNASSSSFII